MKRIEIYTNVEHTICSVEDIATGKKVYAKNASIKTQMEIKNAFKEIMKDFKML